MSKKDSGSRFDALFGAARNKVSEQLTPEQPAVDEGDRPQAKGKDPNYQRTTLYLPKALHRKFKAAALEEDREMSAIMEDLIQQWLESRRSS